jgi:hypothetical protein
VSSRPPLRHAEKRTARVVAARSDGGRAETRRRSPAGRSGPRLKPGPLGASSMTETKKALRCHLPRKPPWRMTRGRCARPSSSLLGHRRRDASRGSPHRSSASTATRSRWGGTPSSPPSIPRRSTENGVVGTRRARTSVQRSGRSATAGSPGGDRRSAGSGGLRWAPVRRPEPE